MTFAWSLHRVSSNVGHYAPPVDFDTYALVILKRGARAAEIADDELERLQAAHLAHLDAMREAGKLAAAGPFSDQPDESLRGLCIYTTSVDEARELAGRDPAVQADGSRSRS